MESQRDFFYSKPSNPYYFSLKQFANVIRGKHLSYYIGSFKNKLILVHSVCILLFMRIRQCYWNAKTFVYVYVVYVFLIYTCVCVYCIYWQTSDWGVAKNQCYGASVTPIKSRRTVLCAEKGVVSSVKIKFYILRESHSYI